MNLSYLAASPKEGNRKCADKHVELMEALQSRINQLALWKYFSCKRSKQAKEAVSCEQRGLCGMFACWVGSWVTTLS